MSSLKSSQLVFYVNGVKVVEDNPQPGAVLAQYLREKLKLTGTKIACGEGACGSCTVLLSKFDRQTSKILHYSINSCITPLCSLHGLAVTTVEAVGSTRGKLHPLQRELAEGHGVQCGYCSPGMVMSMYALMKNNIKPSELDIEHALKGNLCRCTGYRPILDAFRNFAADGDDGSNGCPMGENCCKNKKAKLADASDEFSFSEKNQELIFPSELQLTDRYDKESLYFKCESVTFYRPVTLKELLQLKAEHPRAEIISGATSLVFKMKTALVEQPMTVISTSSVDDLHQINQSDHELRVGAAVSMSLLESHLKSIIKQLPEHKTRIAAEILQMLRVFGSPQIRGKATIGGSLALAAPQSDINTILLTTDCSVEIRTSKGERKVKLNTDFYSAATNGPTILAGDEVIVKVYIPFTEENDYYSSFKVSPRKDMCPADLNGCVRVTFDSPKSNVIKSITMAFGGVDNRVTALILQSSCKAVVGRKWDESLIYFWTPLVLNEIKEKITGQQIPVYKQNLVQGFLLKFFLKIYDKIQPKLGLSTLSDENRTYLERVDKDIVHTGVQVFQVEPGETEADAVGKPIPHRAATQCTTGEAVYIDDMKPLAGELYLCPVVSTKASAKIIEIDTSAALAIPGVVDYIDHNSLSPERNLVHCGIPWVPKEEIFAVKEVHWIGQTIGAILAESHELARLAAKAVVVKYEEMEAIFSIDEAMAKNSFHPWPFPEMGTINYGDTATAMTKAEHVIEGEVRMGGQEHFYMETQCARVVPTGEADELDVYAGTQNQAAIQEKISHVLGIQSNKITVHTKRIGGAFGGKEGRAFLVALPTAVAAKKLNRPVRCFLDRKTDMQISGNRRPYLAKYKIGCNSDGKLTAIEVDMYANDGYIADYSHLFMCMSLFYFNNCYSIPNMIGRGHSCKTNLPPCVPMRGAGGPQGFFIAEYWMSHVATHLGLPQHLIRERNLYQVNEMTYVNLRIDEALSRCFFDSMKQSNYEQMRKDVELFNTKNRYTKRGVFVMPLRFSVGMPPSWCMANALVNIYLDGSVLISHGGQESGQGLYTKMIQIATRVLGVPVDKIHISETNTSVTPNAVTTGGSSGTELNGMAVLYACEKLVARLKPIKEASPNDTWEEIITKAYAQKVNLSAAGFFNKSTHEDFDWKTGSGKAFQYFSYGSCASMVEVDILTGSHKILSVDIVMDVGKSINPAIDIGQIEGGFMMGVGYHCLEEHIFDDKGDLTTKGSRKYFIPTVNSIPHRMNVTLLKDSKNEAAIYSSKAIGEPPMLLSPSVFFAIREAVLAARADRGLSKDFQFNSPATMQTILEACNGESADIKLSKD